MTSHASKDEASASTVCPLSIGQQRRNQVRYAVHMGLIYLAAPAVYVGNLDAVLLNKLGYSDKIANLPAAAYLWSTAPLMVLFAWYFCYVRMLKPVLVVSYAVSAIAGLVAVVSLWQPTSDWLVGAMVVRAMLLGCSLGISGIFEWEILARGVDEKRRGFALGLAFGFGPVLAVISSLGTQLVLDGKLGPIHTGTLDFPADFIVLFATSTLIMAIPAISSTRYIVPVPEAENPREPLLSGVFGGFGAFVRNRLLMFTTAAFLLTMLGSDAVLPSVVLFTKQVLGESPQKYAGYQLALRFAFKVVAGFSLGWMLVRTNPRAGLLTTTLFCLGGLVSALLFTGEWYLVSFGLLGAGELYFVYYSNFITTCSSAMQIRRNLAYLNLLAMPVAFAPVMFGAISDNYGLALSIELAAGLLAAALIIVLCCLPQRPSPASSA